VLGQAMISLDIQLLIRNQKPGYNSSESNLKESITLSVED